MNLASIAATHAAYQAVTATLDRAARRVFDAAAAYKDSRPLEEHMLIEDHFGKWNSERDHIFWAETDYYEAKLRSPDRVTIETGYTLQCETNTFWLDFPAAWLTLTDAELNATLAAEWDKLLTEAREAQAKQERKATWDRYQSYLALKEEFEGQPVPQEPAP